MGSASLITTVCCEAVRSAILATAWLLVLILRPSRVYVLFQVSAKLAKRVLAKREDTVLKRLCYSVSSVCRLSGHVTDDVTSRDPERSSRDS